MFPRRSLIALAIVAVAARANAQSASSDEPVCFGFAFGTWTPVLDWRAAGHGPMPDSTKFQRSPSGRDWASDLPVDRDSLLVLFPSWWPAGVGIALPKRTPGPGDTLTGKAMAFTADGRVANPTSRVRAWRVPCAGPPKDYLEPSTN